MIWVLIAAAVLGGTALVALVEDEAPVLIRACAGAVVGWCLECLVGYALASVLGLHAGASLGAAAVTLLPAALRWRRRRWRLSASRAAIVAVLAAAAISWLLCGRAFYERPDGIRTADFSNYGDLSFHLAITCDFLYGQRFPPESPALGDTRLAYPFLMDFGAGLLATGGAPLARAYQAESALLLFCTMILLYGWARQLTRDGLAGGLAVALFLLNGGLGFFKFMQDAAGSPQGPWSLLGHLPRDYTIDPSGGLRWGNVVTTLLLPERTLLLGLPLALIVFRWWWQALDRDDGGEAAAAEPTSPVSDRPLRGSSLPLTARAAARAQAAAAEPTSPRSDRPLRDSFLPLTAQAAARARHRMVGAGLVTSLLPLAHTSSYGVVMAAGILLALLFFRRTGLRPWLAWGVGALALGLPQLLLLAGGSHLRSGAFLAWQPGWDHGTMAIVPFWLYNTGAFIPLLLVALLANAGDRPWLVDTFTLRYYAPFALCFLVPNLLRLAPWIWDNIKVLVFWHAASVPFVALLLVRLFRAGTGWRVIGVALLVVLTAAGALDVWRVADGQTDNLLLGREGIDFARYVRAVTPRNALVLHAPVANHPLVLSGRRALLGYPGHVWSQGLDPGHREEEIRKVYAGEAGARTILARDHVDFVAVGPQERSELKIDYRFLSRMPAARCGSYLLFRVVSP